MIRDETSLHLLHQTLTAGQNPRCAAVAREQAESVYELARSVVLVDRLGIHELQTSARYAFSGPLWAGTIRSLANDGRSRRDNRDKRYLAGRGLAARKYLGVTSDSARPGCEDESALELHGGVGIGATHEGAALRAGRDSLLVA